MIPNITLFITVMLLTVAFLRQATADTNEQRQDPDNVCYIDSTCKPTGSTNNPFEENDDELQ